MASSGREAKAEAGRVMNGLPGLQSRRDEGQTRGGLGMFWREEGSAQYCMTETGSQHW